jgi:uncharacterized protein DUF2442
MKRVRSVEMLGGFIVRLGLTDGSSEIVDLEPLLRGPIFEPIRRDPQQFRAVTVDPRAGTIVWPNGADIDPDVLCEGRAPSWETVPLAEQQTTTVRSA